MVIKAFLLGVIFLGCSVAGLFFLRFFRATRDRLFAGFAVAFFLMAANQVAFLVIDERGGPRLIAYVSRLLSFVVILWAILDKNRRG
jgi:hypothetical protein